MHLEVDDVFPVGHPLLQQSRVFSFYNLRRGGTAPFSL